MCEWGTVNQVSLAVVPTERRNVETFSSMLAGFGVDVECDFLLANRGHRGDSFRPSRIGSDVGTCCMQSAT